MSAIDKDIVRSRLARLQYHLARIDERCPGTLDELMSSADARDIVAHNLEKSIQVCIDICTHICAAHGRSTQTAVESFGVMVDLGLLDGGLSGRLGKAVGFRNISVHEYAEIDWAIVFRIAVNDIQDLKQFGRALAALVSE